MVCFTLEFQIKEKIFHPCTRHQLLFSIDLFIMALGSIFLYRVKVNDCIYCQNESGYANVIQNPHFLASRHQFLFSIDHIIMAMNSIFLSGFPVNDCRFCEDESKYTYIIQNPCFLASRHQFYSVLIL